MDIIDPIEDRYVPNNVTDFSKIRVGIKQLSDAVVTLGDYKKANERLGDKQAVLDAISRYDLEKMRDISNFFYRVSGIYNRLCRYMAYLYRYDWFVTPYENNVADLLIDDEFVEQKAKEKMFSNFMKVLRFFDNSEIKKTFGEIAFKVIKQGCYYGYLIPNANRFVLQELPIKYCRSRYSVNGRAAVEFNMSFFDDMYSDKDQRLRIIKLFPKEFTKGYKAYKDGKLQGDYQGDTRGWYLLDINSTVKFNINGEDFPPFISVIPAIIDLNAAQELDRKKMAQKLAKIIVQKLPLNKDMEMVFDVEEAQALHNNAVKMLSRAIGLDVLTTFADVSVEDMADKSTTNSVDELEKIERTVYNEAGVSQLQFNSDGNIALNNSILNDEASLYTLISQMENFLNFLLELGFNKGIKHYYKAQLLTTTVYNYQTMAKLYKEQAQMGYSKMLPQVALGQSQSSILANAYFENNVLDLVSVFVPPLTSNTMNAEALSNRDHANVNSEASNKNSTSEAQSAETSSEEGGRPEKDDSEKSEKTIQNRAAM